MTNGLGPCYRGSMKARDPIQNYLPDENKPAPIKDWYLYPDLGVGPVFPRTRKEVYASIICLGGFVAVFVFGALIYGH